MGQPRGVFLREATGLVREVSPIEAGLWNIAASGPLTVGLAYTISYWLSNYPRVNLPLAYVIAVIFTFFFSGSAALLSSAMPRSGGDYVFTGRILHPIIGFLSSWNMFIYNTFTGIGPFAGYLTYFAIGPMLYVIGALSGNPTIIQIGESTLVLPWSLIIIVSLIIIYGIIFLFGLKLSVKLGVACIVGAWICLIITMVCLSTISQSDFIDRFNQIAYMISGKPDAYQYIIETAKSFGYSTETEPQSYAIGDILGLVGLVSMSVSWQWMHIYYAGEVKKANDPLRQLLIISIPLISHLLGMALCGWLLINKAGGEFLNAYNYLSTYHPESLPFYVTGGGYTIFLMAITGPNIIIATLICLSAVFSALGIMFVFYFVTRILFAWSFDRIFPAWVADVDERLHSPIKATLIFIILSLIGGIIYGVRSDLLLPLFAAAGSGSAIFAWIPICLTAILFPFIKPTLYKATPLRTLSIKGVPLVSLFGVIGLVYCSYIAYSFWLATTFEGYLTIILVAIIGIIIFYFAKWYRKRQGIDLNLLFKEIPPE
jgi:amino acid transporter